MKAVPKAVLELLACYLLLLVFAGSLVPASGLGAGTPFSRVNETPIPPTALSVRLGWPLMGKPAIALNSSNFEVRLSGPGNISDWTFMLWREYRNYTLSYGSPAYNSTSGEWCANVTIPANAVRDLYDLRITASDGISETTIEEWNAVQVRYSFPDNFTIFHITDTHFYSFTSESSTKLLYSLYQANMANADLIIMTGDLTDDGAGGSFVFFRQILRQSRIPTFLCPGNHDRDSWGNTYGTLMYYFGPDYFTASFGPDVFIVLANSHGDRILNTTQIAWIRRDMAASSAQVKILAFHHPLYNVLDPPTYFLDPAEAAELLNITDAYDVDVVLTGHLHNDRVDFINGTCWIMTTTDGGSVYRNPTDPGSHRNGFRILRFTDYQMTSWNWTLSQPWSLPWDEVALSRTPTYFHTPDIGAVLTITNHLNYSLSNQIVEFLVQPFTSSVVYLVTGASVLETVNATTAWLARLMVDLPAGASAVVRIYPSNAQAPVIDDIDYPAIAFTGALAFIYANVTNPSSGIQAVGLNCSLDGGSFGFAAMGIIAPNRYRFYRVFDHAGLFRFQVVAWDYAGYKVSTPLYEFNIIVSYPPTSPHFSSLPSSDDDGTFTVSWNASTDSDGTVHHYQLQMSSDASFATLLQQWNTTDLSVQTSGLGDGTYHFRVRAVDNKGIVSPWSTSVSVVVTIPTPPPPPIPGFPWPAILLAGVLAVSLTLFRRRRVR